MASLPQSDEFNHAGTRRGVNESTNIGCFTKFNNKMDKSSEERRDRDPEFRVRIVQMVNRE